MLGLMHVDHSLRGPDPVIFGADLAGHLVIISVLDFVPPLHARKIDSPLVAGVGWVVSTDAMPGQIREWKGDLDGPSLVDIAWVVQRSIDMHFRNQPGQVGAKDRGAAVGVAFDEC